MLRHDQRVGFLAKELCRFLALGDELSGQIVQAARMHDIGKREIPTAILQKRGALDKEELAILRRHTTIGAALLKRRGLDFAATVALRHHELWDGSGYPDGIKGDSIPFASRLITICDVYAALRETRPYRPSLPHREAIEIMLKGDPSGKTRPGMFDPALLEAFDRHQTNLAQAIEQLQGGGPLAANSTLDTTPP